MGSFQARRRGSWGLISKRLFTYSASAGPSLETRRKGGRKCKKLSFINRLPFAMDDFHKPPTGSRCMNFLRTVGRALQDRKPSGVGLRRALNF
jgi:hypothetical protein